MIITFDGLGDMEESFIDVSAIFEEHAIMNERDLYGRIMFAVAERIADAGCLMSDTWINRVEVDYHEVSTPSGDIWEEVAGLLYWSHGKSECEYMPILAMAHEDWHSVMFDELDNVQNSCIGVIESAMPYEDWVDEYLNSMDQGIPDHVKEFFDYDAYMGHIRRDYWVITYEDDEYVFIQ